MIRWRVRRDARGGGSILRLGDVVGLRSALCETGDQFRDCLTLEPGSGGLVRIPVLSPRDTLSGKAKPGHGAET